MTLISADSGSMFGSTDGNYFVMQLYHGSQLTEPKPKSEKGKRNYPMMRSNFKEWTKVFDLDEFELDRTDEGLFKSHYSMLSNRQLLIAIDSIDRHISDRKARFDQQTNRHFHFFEKAAQAKKAEERKAMAAKKKAEKVKKEKLGKNKKEAAKAKKKPEAKPQKPPKKKKKKAVKKTKKKPVKKKKKPKKKPKKTAKKKDHKPWKQTIDRPLSEYKSIAGTFTSENADEAIKKAMGTVRTIRDQSKSSQKSLEKTFQSRVKHVFEFNSKFSLAVACFIFLFVGAPMGAIVRKGGFGLPLLISIIFFMLFIIIGIFSKNIAERRVIDATLSAWMGCLVIFPMGLLLTYWAMRDMGWSQIVEVFKFKLPGRSK